MEVMRYYEVVSVYLSMVLQPFVGPWLVFSFLIFYTVCRVLLTGNQIVAGPLSTHMSAQTQTERTQASMLLVGFEPMILVLERGKKIHALDRAATVIG
jgi:hypothetical protein